MPQPKKSSSSGGRSAAARGGSSRRTSARKPAAAKATATRKPASGAKRPAAAAKRSTTAAKRTTTAAAKRSSTAKKRTATATAAKRTTAAKKPAAAKRASTAKRASAPKRSTAARRPPARPAAASSAPASPPPSQAGLVALRDAIQSRANDSLNLVMLTRERVQEAFDEAVERGHMTRETANSLAQDLVQRTRREATDIIADLEQIAGRSRSGLESAGKRVRTSTAADRALQQVDRARRTVGVGPNFPVLGYDDLNAGQIGERLDGLTPAQLRKVRDYERRNGNRKSVLASIERKLG